MQKILIIVNDLRNGGVERVLSILANYFASLHHQVYILAIRDEQVSYEIGPAIHYEYMPLAKKDQRLSLFSELCLMARIGKYIGKINPDWLIAFDDSIIVRSVPGAWLQRKKILVSETQL